MNTKSDLYKKQIVKTLSFGKSLPAYDISVGIERSLPLTNRILAEMIEEGILREDGLALSTGGRRAATYSIVPGVASVLSVAMDQYVTKISTLDISEMKITNLRKYELPLQKNDQALSQFEDILKEYLDNVVIDTKNLIGIGIGMPGFVDVKKGINYSFLKIPGKKPGALTDYLEEKLGIPVFIGNDSSTIALTEHILGPASGKRNTLVINFGWGVGLGMILNGRWFRGSNGFAGEFSHIPLFDNNKLCSCGKSGCLETGASMLTIIEDFKVALENGRASIVDSIPDSLEEASAILVDAVISGDQLAVELFTQVAYDIGRGIAILIHILNPEQIIISGRGASAGQVLLAPIYQAINKFCIPRLSSYTEILVSDLSVNSEIFGSAALVTENMTRKQIRLMKHQID